MFCKLEVEMEGKLPAQESIKLMITKTQAARTEAVLAGSWSVEWKNL